MIICFLLFCRKRIITLILNWVIASYPLLHIRIDHIIQLCGVAKLPICFCAMACVNMVDTGLAFTGAQDERKPLVKKTTKTDENKGT